MEESSEILTIFREGIASDRTFYFCAGYCALRRRKEEVRPRWGSLDGAIACRQRRGIFRRAGAKSGLGRFWVIDTGYPVFAPKDVIVSALTKSLKSSTVWRSYPA